MARRPPAKPPEKTPIGLILGIVALLVLGIGLIAFAATRTSDEGEDIAGLEQVQAVAVAGPVLDPFVLGAEDTAVGAAAPTLTGSSFDGSPVTVEPGRPTLVIFLAHWCPHCQREVPVLVDWFASGSVPDELDIIGVATATDRSAPNYPPSAWLEEEGFPWPVMADTADQVAAAAMGLSGYPYFVVLDANGTVVQRASGEVETAVLDAAIAQALALG